MEGAGPAFPFHEPGGTISWEGVSIRHQCQLLSLPRSTLYYQPQPASSEELMLMRLTDEQY